MSREPGVLAVRRLAWMIAAAIGVLAGFWLLWAVWAGYVPARRQHAAASRLEAIGARVLFASSRFDLLSPSRLFGTAWLVEIWGPIEDPAVDLILALDTTFDLKTSPWKYIGDSRHQRFPYQHVTEEALERLAALKRVRFLRLEDVDVHDDALRGLSQCPPLAGLIVTGPDFDGSGLRFVGNPGAPYALTVGGPRFSDAGAAYLSRFTNLEMLDLSGTPITDAALASIAGMRGLTTLNLSNTGVGDEGLRHLAAVSSLRWLNLKGTKVTDAGLPHLYGLKRLSDVYLPAPPAVTEAEKAKLRKMLPNCDSVP